MRILIISDTHYMVSDVLYAIDKIKPDYTFHLGDMADDCDKIIEEYPSINFNAVLGNNDFFDFRRNKYENELLVTIDSVTIFMCHGHTYNVRTGIYELKKKALKTNANIVLFGHTHNKMCECENGVYYCNPGAGSVTYALIETNGGNPKITLNYFDDLKKDK